MKRSLLFTCLSLLISLASFGQGPITGALHSCNWDTSSVYAATAGGVWTSDNTLVATVGVTSPGSPHALVTAVWPGTCTISYTIGGSATATAVYTVDLSPTEFASFTTMCIGVWTIYTDAIPGGVWSSDNTAIATIDPVSGHLTGVSAGPVNIWYTLSNGCSFGSSSLTITSTPTGAITGPSAVCTGSSVTYTNTVTTGTWYSSDPSVVTIDPATGAATGISAGTANISYSNSGICGVLSIFDTVTVSGSVPVPTLSGPSDVYVGASIALTTSSGGGTWSSSNTAIATVSPSGVVYGVSPGAVSINYSIAGCSGTLTATTPVSVSNFDGISGNVIFGGAYSGPVRVWLISYDPATSDLEAVDSVTVTCSGASSVHYAFTGVPTDSFRVKASVSFGTTFVGTSYLPTYYTAAYYWHDAAVIYHTSGASDINKNITMASGGSAPGSGFIGGSVTTGANRGTSDGVPVQHLLVYAVDAITGNIIQHTYTTSGGYYTFTTLPFGSYRIYPEQINYSTIPYSDITLSSGSPSVSLANFKSHTISHVISPVSESVKNVQQGLVNVAAYPNPASDKLNLSWTVAENETGNVTLYDVTGKAVYKTTLSITAGNGAAQLRLPALADGTYTLTIKSASISYTDKIAIQH